MCADTDTSSSDGSAHQDGGAAVTFNTLLDIPVVAAALRHTAISSTCHDWLDACRYTAWSPVLLVLVPKVVSFLGPSRCSPLSATSRAWCEEVKSEQRSRLAAASAAAIAAGESPSLLRALSAPHFCATSSLEDEDRVFETIQLLRSAERLGPALVESCDISGYTDIYLMLQSLQRSCQVSPACLDVLLAPRLERRKTTLLAPQPLHFALARGSPRLVRLLARAGALAEVLPQMMESEGSGCPALSPTLFTLLCGGDEVVLELLRHRPSAGPDTDSDSESTRTGGSSSDPDSASSLDSSTAAASSTSSSSSPASSSPPAMSSASPGLGARARGRARRARETVVVEVDVAATQRLQKADLWGEVRARTEALGVREIATALESAVIQKQEQVARLRASVRAALLS